MTRFTMLDAIVLVAYLAGTTGLGLYVGRKQRNASDYFVADKAIPWWAVMFSIVASETSALTFISIPGLSYGAATGTGNLGFLEVVAGYILGRIADYPVNRLDDFLPWNWRALPAASLAA